MKSLVDQEVLRFGNVALAARIDDDGARIYQVLGASLALPPVLANPSLRPVAAAPAPQRRRR